MGLNNQITPEAFPKLRTAVLQNPILSAIYIYPVKSCRGIAVNSARLNTWSLEGDRRWMVIDATL